MKTFKLDHNNKVLHETFKKISGDAKLRKHELQSYLNARYKQDVAKSIMLRITGD